MGSQHFFYICVEGNSRVVSKKFIAQLLLICFSVILGHQWIPHDHHADVLASGSSASCPLDHQDQHIPGKHPSHCHAFNDLAFFKEDPSDTLNKIQESDQMDAIIAFDRQMDSVPPARLVNVPPGVIVPTSDHQDPVPARGPPALT
ncbi:MAG: hypothetical protein ACWGNV_11685 [Bacteroidales bacterium]